jgi:hypothetical protein
MANEGQPLSADMLSGRITIDWDHPLEIYTISSASTFYPAKTEFGINAIVKAGKSDGGWRMLENEIAFLGNPTAENIITQRRLVPPYRIERDAQGRKVLIMADLKENGYRENFRDLVDNVPLPERRIIFVDLMSQIGNLVDTVSRKRYTLKDILGGDGKGIWFKKNPETQRYDFLFTDFGLVEKQISDPTFTNTRSLLVREENGSPSLLPSCFSSLLHVEAGRVIVNDEILNAFENGALAKILTQISNGEIEFSYDAAKSININYPLELWRFFSRLKNQIPTSVLLTPESEKPPFSLGEFIQLLLEGDSALKPEQLQRYAAHFGLTTRALREQLAAAQEKLETK